MKTFQDGIDLIKKWAVVREETACWPFVGKNLVASKGGRLKYGQVTFKGKKWRAHRLVATICGNKLTPKDHVCHSCDNPICLNPAHLFVGSSADNMADKMAKGRHRVTYGERSGKATISDADVAEVRRLALAGVNQRILAEKFKISQPLVSMIKNGKTRTRANENQF